MSLCTTFCKWFQLNNPALLGLHFDVHVEAFPCHCLTSKSMAPVSEQLPPNLTQQSMQNFKLVDKYTQFTPTQISFLMVLRDSVRVEKKKVCSCFFYILGSVMIRKLVKNGIKINLYSFTRELAPCCENQSETFDISCHFCSKYSRNPVN